MDIIEDINNIDNTDQLKKKACFCCCTCCTLCYCGCLFWVFMLSSVSILITALVFEYLREPPSYGTTFELTFCDGTVYSPVFGVDYHFNNLNR